MTKKEIGLAIFDIVQADLEKSGHSATARNLPENYPVSRAFLYNMRGGKFSVQKVLALPCEIPNDIKLALLDAK